MKYLVVICALTLGVVAFDTFESRVRRENPDHPAHSINTVPVPAALPSPLLTSSLFLIKTNTDLEWNAMQLAAEFCRALGGCPAPVEIYVYPPVAMPRGVLAFTTRNERDENGTGCALTFDWRATASPNVVAHEVCHCVYDHAVMDGIGYVGAARGETDVRERRAIACAERLTR